MVPPPPPATSASESSGPQGLPKPAAMAAAELPPSSVAEPPSAAGSAPGEDHIPMDTPASSMEDRALTRPDLLPNVDYPPSVESLATVSAISGTNSALEMMSSFGVD